MKSRRMAMKHIARQFKVTGVLMSAFPLGRYLKKESDRMPHSLISVINGLFIMRIR